MGAMNGTFLKVFKMVEGRESLLEIEAREGSRVRDITGERCIAQFSQRKLVWNGIVIKLHKIKMWEKIDMTLLLDPKFV